MKAWQRPVLIAAGLVGLAGCTQSEADVRKEFADYVAGANSCRVAADCTVAYGACPVGCWVAVRSDRKSDVEAKARELVDAYNRYGQSCVYGCTTPGPVACVEARCFAQPDFSSVASPDAGSDAH